MSVILIVDIALCNAFAYLLSGSVPTSGFARLLSLRLPGGPRNVTRHLARIIPSISSFVLVVQHSVAIAAIRQTDCLDGWSTVEHIE